MFAIAVSLIASAAVYPPIHQPPHTPQPRAERPLTLIEKSDALGYRIMVVQGCIRFVPQDSALREVVDMTTYPESFRSVAEYALAEGKRIEARRLSSERCYDLLEDQERQFLRAFRDAR